MFQNVKKAFQIKEIRNRLIFTVIMLFVIRFGSQLPVPGVDRTYFSRWLAQQTSGDAFSLFDAFTGGSFLNMSILALNITPYITASIILQLLTIAIPKLEEMQREGEEGRKLIVSITRYVTVALSVIEAAAMAIGFGRNGLLQDYNALNVITVIVVLTAGSAVVMWLGERITEKGVGNGISIVLTINIVSRIPSDIVTLFQQFVVGKKIATEVVNSVIIVGIIIGMTVLVILLNDAERHIPVQYARKIQGRRQVGSTTSSIPLKVNTGGVMPIIFASSIMEFPVIISTLVGYKGSGWWSEVLKYLSSTYWLNPAQMRYSVGLIVYVLLLIFFAYFYTSITFNPIEIADNLKKSGGFIPGIRPGKPTSEYLNRILNYIIFIGAVGLTVVAVLPIFLRGVFNADISFGGTSLIIVVSVVLETIKQIESMMMVQNYKGFLSE
ncbi:MAG: preprotein translocase subunit SecY [Lachnospiraceae bacterium]|jgi:preprotein translocase subunit SecY|nr:preprotein translocase subunit SecY [Lachnospiraceae bacterium]MCH4028096.1 preprotein translocase subunit SecY [Lachnospiraceae bacterium]MCH4065940.1 preprotein translocase subunit SecY [Lachnospiraceae bacterium]MCH4111976.1 preprotein translocase subunit SecY [Lachnospiraceae bacterium]MCI1353472.1 preprotein translocase subunit SecY [Lachnospiraceae bacterium]